MDRATAHCSSTSGIWEFHLGGDHTVSGVRGPDSEYNVAVVFRVIVKDSSTGTDRELQFNVKGKSKGVYGASRGLAITG